MKLTTVEGKEIKAVHLTPPSASQFGIV